MSPGFPDKSVSPVKSWPVKVSTVIVPVSSLLTDALLPATALTAHESLVPAATLGTVTDTLQIEDEPYVTVTSGHAVSQPFKLDTEIVKVSSKLPLFVISKEIVRSPGARFISEDVVKLKELVLETSIVVPKSGEISDSSESITVNVTDLNPPLSSIIDDSGTLTV